MNFRNCLAVGTALLGCMAAGTASAQAAASPDQLAAEQADAGQAGGEIIVTANKRAESIQSVPLSISAIGGDTLAKSRVGSLDAITAKVVNLQLNSFVGDDTPIFSLRGVSMSDYSLNQSSPVATYFDEVYKGNFAFLGVSMFDLDRVEVLRGPQGTLYGKNTTGGAVNLISRTPKLGETDASVSAGYGNYNRFDLDGAVSVPLGDKLALRVAGTLSRADGWLKNVVPGQPDLASTRQYAIRGTLRYEPAPGVSFLLRAAHSYQDPTNYGIYAQPEATLRPGLSTYQIASNVTDRRIAEATSVSLTGKLEVSDQFTVTSITSWDKGRLSFTEDTSGQAVSILNIPYADRANQIAQDLRLTSNFKGPFNFIIGAYYNRESVFNSTNLRIFQSLDVNGDGALNSQDCVDGLALGGAACQFSNSFNQVKNSFAIYSDAKYAISDVFTLRGGLRYTHDKGTQSNFQTDVLGPDNVFILTTIPKSSLDYSANNVSGKLGFDINLPDHKLIYASVSTGYRAPSFNAQAFFDPSELTVATAEMVTSYEVGIKTQFWDRRITFNAAAFYYNYRNQQFIDVNPQTAVSRLLNLPKSRIFGGEAELTVRPNDRLTLHTGIGLLDAKAKVGTVSGVDVAGSQLPTAPHFSFNGGVDLVLVQGNLGTLSVHPEMTYQSSMFFSVVNTERLRSPAYALVNGHIDWESSDGHWNASLWAKNLGNKFYYTARLDLSGGFGLDYNRLGTPRTFGVTVGYKL
jgi:iron complex outermembrane receptor protein